MSPSPEDKRYRDSLSPPCPTLVVDNVPPDVSAEAITSIFSKVRDWFCFRQEAALQFRRYLISLV